MIGSFSARGQDLLGIGVMDDVGGDHRRQHQHADRRVGAVDDLMRALLAARKADDVTLFQDLFALGRAEHRLAGQHDHPLLVRVVRGIRPELVARLDLGHACADQLAADVVADKWAVLTVPWVDR
jgi:hypothetical protein